MASHSGRGQLRGFLVYATGSMLRATATRLAAQAICARRAVVESVEPESAVYR